MQPITIRNQIRTSGPLSECFMNENLVSLSQPAPHPHPHLHPHRHHHRCPAVDVDVHRPMVTLIAN